MQSEDNPRWMSKRPIRPAKRPLQRATSAFGTVFLQKLKQEMKAIHCLSADPIACPHAVIHDHTSGSRDNIILQQGLSTQEEDDQDDDDDQQHARDPDEDGKQIFLWRRRRGTGRTIRLERAAREPAARRDLIGKIFQAAARRACRSGLLHVERLRRGNGPGGFGIALQSSGHGLNRAAKLATTNPAGERIVDFEDLLAARAGK